MLKRNHEESSSTSEWLNTYSDVVTLLLTFFVFMFAISSVDAKKWQMVVEAFNKDTKAIEQVIKGNTIVATSDPDKTNALNTSENELSTSEVKPVDFDEIYRMIKNYIEKNGLKDNIDISKTDNYIFLRFKDNVLFNPDSPVLTAEGKNILGFIAGELKEVQKKIDLVEIEGHTADSNNGQYSVFSWELSVSRAVNVLRFLVEDQKLDPAKMSAAGYSKYHPISSNDTEAGRSRNRRVEITITKIKD